jgi:hypothetical protein
VGHDWRLGFIVGLLFFNFLLHFAHHGQSPEKEAVLNEGSRRRLGLLLEYRS